MPESGFVIEGARALSHPADRVYAAIADPEAYFTWNDSVRLLDRVETLAPEMELRIYSGTLGHTRYVQRNDDAQRTVTHDVGLRLRFLTLGRELHVWRVRNRADGDEGCLLEQEMRVRPTTWLGRRLAGSLESQLATVHEENFDKLDAWLAEAPALEDGRLRVAG